MKPTKKRSTSGGTGVDNGWMVSKCQELIRTFNPVTHSVDTHCLEALGDVKSPDVKPENLFVQQVVYGCFKETSVLKAFIDVFYAENSSRVLRSDITLYTVLAYIAIFRVDELGFFKLKDICLSQEPSKVNTLVTYLFDSENLWNSLRAAWMKVRDLEYVENQMIPRMEKYVPDAMRFSFELEKNAVANAAAEAAKEELKAKGEAGLPKVDKKPTTRPISPNLTRPRPPVIPEPERIGHMTFSHEVPGFLENTNLSKIAQQREAERLAALQATKDKYGNGVQPFDLSQTKGGRSVAEIQKEVEDKFLSELQFDASFVHTPPDFSKQKSFQQQVKANASAIYREDAIYRKQQAKDVKLLKAYEEELRDPMEFYLWQKEMRERDHTEKLEKVVFRREQAKSSAIEAKEAMLKQKEDKFTVAEMLREQAEVIKQQRDLENEIAMLKNQAVAREIAEIRDTKPKEAGLKAIEDRAARAQRLREEMEAARLAKIEEDKVEEEEKADKIRQLRALNTVHKKHIVVFDPTETAGHRLSSEMSYMEMKERLKNEKAQQEEREQLKRVQIDNDKQRRQLDLERRQASTLRARQVKAEANSTVREREMDRKKKEAEDIENARRIAAEKLDRELKEKKEVAKAEKAAMKAEQDRIKRQQQYMGAAMGQVEAMREEQMEMARRRQAETLDRNQREMQALYQETAMKEFDNKLTLERKEKHLRDATLKEKHEQFKYEKKAYLNKLKESVLQKKDLFHSGQKQHESTKTVLLEHNPYAQKISQESLTKVMLTRKRVSKSGGNSRTREFDVDSDVSDS